MVNFFKNYTLKDFQLDLKVFGGAFLSLYLFRWVYIALWAIAQ